MEYYDLRREYDHPPLLRENLNDSPFTQFTNWFEDVKNAKILEPNAMSLATATQDGKPSCRMVLMKHFDTQGVTFFTNYNSKKAQVLNENPFASIVFFWRELDRQVIIEGSVTKVDRKTSEKYFAARPRDSQLGTWASHHQSQPIPSHKILEDEYKTLKERFKNQEIPCPPFWGGFLIIPTYFEFWQGRANRLHDRYCYQLNNGQWSIEQLAP